MLMSQIPADVAGPFTIRDASAPACGGSLHWSWACRHLATDTIWTTASDVETPPAPGDLGLFTVEQLGQHERLVMRDNRRLRIYPGDMIVGVFGSRYATDAYEAELDGLDDLSLLTGGGMVGTVRSRHRKTSAATRLRFDGFLGDERGRRVNLKTRLFAPRRAVILPRRLFLVVGTGMNTGKTTSSVKLIKGLGEQGLSVAACKLTGSVSNRDQDEMRAASARLVLDFSDYGFPSTYLCEREELLALWHTMLADIEKVQADVVVMELADGILQRETALLLRERAVRAAVTGVVVTADSALSALAAVGRVQQLGYEIAAVTGLFTSSPLYVREFSEESSVPAYSSAGSAAELVQRIATCGAVGS